MSEPLHPLALWLAAAVMGIGLGGWWSSWRPPSGWRGWLAAGAAAGLLVWCGYEAAGGATAAGALALGWGGFASGAACALAYGLCARAVATAELDYVASGRLAYAHAEALKEELRTEEAIKLMLVSRHFLKLALENHDPDKDPFQFAIRCGDFAATLVNLGCWQDDLSILGEAENTLRRALDCFDPESDAERYTHAALCNNLGHALYRHGEITRSPAMVRQGLAFLEQALVVFQNPPQGKSWDQALAETRKLIAKASRVEKELR